MQQRITSSSFIDPFLPSKFGAEDNRGSFAKCEWLLETCATSLRSVPYTVHNKSGN